MLRKYLRIPKFLILNVVCIMCLVDLNSSNELTASITSSTYTKRRVNEEEVTLTKRE